jgi:hypothetical protein
MLVPVLEYVEHPNIVREYDNIVPPEFEISNRVDRSNQLSVNNTYALAWGQHSASKLWMVVCFLNVAS